MKNNKGGTASNLRASRFKHYGSRVGSSRSPRPGIVLPSKEGSCNIRSRFDSCGNIMFYSCRLLKYDAERFFGMLERDFGKSDYQGLLDTTPGILQDNWERHGIYVTSHYVEGLRGVVDIDVLCTDVEIWERFLQLLNRIRKKPLSAIQGVLA